MAQDTEQMRAHLEAAQDLYLRVGLVAYYLVYSKLPNLSVAGMTEFSKKMLLDPQVGTMFARLCVMVPEPVTYSLGDVLMMTIKTDVLVPEKAVKAATSLRLLLDEGSIMGGVSVTDERDGVPQFMGKADAGGN